MLHKPTALKVATLRAVHQLLDHPLVFEDPLAVRILGEEAQRALLADPAAYDNPLDRGLRTSVAVRARLAEDAMAEALARGVRQYVILGAGLDTFAWRAQDEDWGAVFEADLPETQRWKRARMIQAGLAEPSFLRFVPVDFERDSLGQALSESGFDGSQPALFTWLGVTMYLEKIAAMNTLGFVGSLAPGSEVVFDYAVTPVLLNPRERQGLELVSQRAAQVGEPWKCFLDPSTLAGELARMGFTHLEDLDAGELNRRYLSGRDDGLRKSGVTRIARARV